MINKSLCLQYLFNLISLKISWNVSSILCVLIFYISLWKYPPGLTHFHNIKWCCIGRRPVTKLGFIKSNQDNLFAVFLFHDVNCHSSLGNSLSVTSRVLRPLAIVNYGTTVHFIMLNKKNLVTRLYYCTKCRYYFCKLIKNRFCGSCTPQFLGGFWQQMTSLWSQEYFNHWPQQTVALFGCKNTLLEEHLVTVTLHLSL